MDETGLLSREEKGLPYTLKSKRLGENATAWIRQHPMDACYLTMRKFTYMWGIYPFWNGWTHTLLGNIPILVLLATGAVAVVVYRNVLGPLSIFWSLPLFVCLVAFISWGSWRFRQPADLGLIVLAASLPFATEVKQFLAGARRSANV